MNNESTDNLNLIDTIFNNIISNLNSGKTSSTLYSNQKNVMKIINDIDPFGISESIKDNENKIDRTLNRTKDFVDVEITYCCVDHNEEKIEEKLYFQFLKIRYAVSKSKEIISLSKNTDIFNLLSSEKYIQLFKEHTDYNKDYISNEINVSFKDLNDETEKLINPTINSLKDNLTNSFENNINEGLIESMIHSLANKIFLLPSNDKIEDKRDLFYDIITNEFDKFNMSLTINKIFIDESFLIVLNKSITDLNNSISNIIFQNLENVNNLIIDNNLLTKVINYYSNVVQTIGNAFEESISKYSATYRDFNFFGLRYNIFEIGKETSDDEVTKLKAFINNKMKEIFTSSFNQQKDNIKNILSNNNKLILNYLKTE